MSQAAIADKIEAQIDRLVDTWIRAVRDDPRIESDNRLSNPELVDHVPAIIHEICDLVRNDKTPDVRNSHEARANVYVRFHQGYKGRDLIREISLLRITVLDFLTAISSDETQALSAEGLQNTARILNLYLDEEMRYAISVYSDSPSSAAPEPSDRQ
jgi:hypothetical protein